MSNENSNHLGSNQEDDIPVSKPARKSAVRRWLLETLIVLVGAVVIASLLRSFVGQMFIIPSGSMEHTIDPGDRVFVAKFGGFHRGDVVVFEDPGGWLNLPKEQHGSVHKALEFLGVLPHSGTDHLIKRVIGMPGDRVRLGESGRIEVNGYPLDESSYLYSEQGVQVAPATVPFDVVVPKDHIFVMGDHRNSSNDSRCNLSRQRGGEPTGSGAFIPISKVVGPAVAIIAPLDRMATFITPEIFTKVPSPGAPAPDKPILYHIESGC